MRIGFFAAVVFATFAWAQAPVISTIAPTSGPDTGGTVVRITGDHLSAAVVCILPCPPRVSFGDVTVDAIEESDDALRVTTPAHVAGTVDVTIAVPGRDPVVVPNGFTFVAGPESVYEQVLLPVSLRAPVSGGFGSKWQTDFWIRNNGTAPVTLAPWQCPKDQACPGVFPLTYTLEPGRSLHNPPDLAGSGKENPGQLLYISRDHADEVAMSLRVGDASRAMLNAGTDLPVIRQGEMLTGTAELFQVPLNGSFRVLLRVYEMAYSEASFAVRVYPQSESVEAPLQGFTLTTRTRQTGPFRSEPAYAEYDLSAILQLPQVLPDSVRVEVDPLTPGSRYWTLVSITNNETQLVTLVTPQ